MVYDRTDYNAAGDWCVGISSLNETRKLTSLEIRCSSPVMKNMSNAEIEANFKKTRDYDANEMQMNVFVNGFCIEFCFNLYGLDVRYNAWEAINPCRTNYIDLDIINKTVAAVAWWFQDKTIDMIDEQFYRTAEKSAAEAILKEFKK